MARLSYKDKYLEAKNELEATNLIIKGLEREILELRSKIKYLNSKIINGCKPVKRADIKYINGYYIHNGKKYNSINEILKI